MFIKSQLWSCCNIQLTILITRKTKRDDLLTKLFLPIKPEVSKNNDKLTNERQPERSRCHWTSYIKNFKHSGHSCSSSQHTFNTITEIPLGSIRKYSTRTKSIRSRRTRNHHTNRSNHLSQRKRRTNMKSRERLQQNHSQSNTLNGIQHTQPQPKRNAKIGPSRTRPWDIKRKRRRPPKHLTPSRRSKPNCKNGQ